MMMMMMIPATMNHYYMYITLPLPLPPAATKIVQFYKQVSNKEIISAA